MLSVCAAKASLAREVVPFTGPGLRLQMRCKEAVRVSRKRGRDSACRPSGIERPDVPELSYSIAFADLHETAMVHSSYSRPFTKLKEVSMGRRLLFVKMNLFFFVWSVLL